MIEKLTHTGKMRWRKPIGVGELGGVLQQEILVEKFDEEKRIYKQHVEWRDVPYEN